MKRWIKRSGSLFLMLLGSFAGAQDLPLESWRMHFGFNTARMVAAGDGKIFCAGQNGLFYYDVDEKTTRKLSKLDGLSDAGVSAMTYDKNYGLLLIGYPSGLVDMVSDTGVTTITDINETNLIGSKKINDITTSQQNAYLATSFGVIVVSLERKEITDTYGSVGRDGQKVTILDVEIIDNQLFAITDAGIQSGSLNANLLDFNNWTHYDETEGDTYSDFASLNEKVYTIQNGKDLAVLNNGTWTVAGLSQAETLVKLHEGAASLLILTNRGIRSFDGEQLQEDLNFTNANDARDFMSEDGFWVADGELGLMAPDEQRIVPNGPASDAMTKIRYTDGNLYAFYAPEPIDYTGQVASLNFSSFDNYKWTTDSIAGFYNVSDVAKFNGQLFFSSMGGGLHNRTTGEALDDSDSPFTNSKSSTGLIIPEMAVGTALYLLSYNNINSLYTLDHDQTITAYSAEYTGTDRPVSLDLSRRNVLWITRSSLAGGGIVTLDLETDDLRILDVEDNLPSNAVNDVAVNQSDEAWVATSAGPSFFGEATFIFDDISGVSPIFEGYNLFDDVAVTAMATDGGDRVWMATREGLWIFDGSVNQLVHHFNTANSPLPSNNILSFAYHPDNGEMYILTEKGLVSYRSNSSVPQPDHSQVKIFPNPVRPGYTGLIGISGLAANVSVKVTDVNGKLIRELEVNGGTASWDLLDYNNNRVNSGIYVIFSASADGNQTYIGKLAVIN